MSYKQISPQNVIEGGTGVQSNTAYAQLCGGTTTTNPIQSIASVGTSGQILLSNGASSLPTFQTFSTLGWTIVAPTATTSGTSVTLSGIPSNIKSIIFSLNQVKGDISGGELLVQLGDSGGIETTGYVGQTNRGTGALDWTNNIAPHSGAATNASKGYIVRINLSLFELSSNTWTASLVGHAYPNATTSFGVGIKSLTGTLTQIKLSIAAGAFTAGSVGMAYST